MADRTAYKKLLIDGDLDKVTITNPSPPPANIVSYKVNTASVVPSLGGFSASPALIEVEGPSGRLPYVVAGNDNGRLYAFVAYGRVTPPPVNPGDPPVGEPWPLTIASAASIGSWPHIVR